jgi:predicted lipoprotein
MSYAPSNFRRTDVKRTVQAMQAAGLKVARVELHGGKVLIIPANDEAVEDDSKNSFDKIMWAKPHLPRLANPSHLPRESRP